MMLTWKSLSLKFPRAMQVSVRDDVDLEELLFEVSESDASVRWEMMLTWNSLALKSLRAMQVFVGDDAYLE